MKIHHFTIPARDPQRVARVLGELLGAEGYKVTNGPPHASFKRPSA